MRFVDGEFSVEDGTVLSRMGASQGSCLPGPEGHVRGGPKQVAITAICNNLLRCSLTALARPFFGSSGVLQPPQLHWLLSLEGTT